MGEIIDSETIENTGKIKGKAYEDDNMFLTNAGVYAILVIAYTVYEV